MGIFDTIKSLASKTVSVVSKVINAVQSVSGTPAKTVSQAISTVSSGSRSSSSSSIGGGSSSSGGGGGTTIIGTIKREIEKTSLTPGIEVQVPLAIKAVVGTAAVTGGIGLVGTATLIKAATAVGFSIASGSGIMTWLASDNIGSGVAIFTRDLRQSVVFGALNPTDALLEMDKQQTLLNEAKAFLEANVAINPLLWPFKGIILANIEGVQNQVDYNRRVISEIEPLTEGDSTNPADSGKTDEEWADIFQENELRKIRERERELAEQVVDDARWARIKEENAAAKEAERISDEEIRAMEDEYWAGVDAKKIARDTANKLAEGAFWDAIRAGETTANAVIAQEKERARYLATGEIIEGVQQPQPTTQPTTQPTATETPLEEPQETQQEETQTTEPEKEEIKPHEFLRFEGNQVITQRVGKDIIDTRSIPNAKQLLRKGLLNKLPDKPTMKGGNENE